MLGEVEIVVLCVQYRQIFDVRQEDFGQIPVGNSMAKVFSKFGKFPVQERDEA